MSIKRRLERIEDTQPAAVDVHERERLRASIREVAEQLNDSRRRNHEEPVLERDEAGTVYTTNGRRLVNGAHQALAEDWYWRHLAWGVRGHDEEAEAFYTPAGELALSRMRCNLAQTFSLYSKQGS